MCLVQGGVPGLGVVCLVWGVVCLVQGGVWSGEGGAWSGPPVNRITDACKNITLWMSTAFNMMISVNLTVPNVEYFHSQH